MPQALTPHALQRLLPRLVLFASLAAGAFLRVGAANRTQGLEAYWYGDWEYYTLGVSLADSGAYRYFPTWPASAFRMPLYPAFVASARWIRPGPAFVRTLQAALDTANIYALWLLGGLLAGPICGALAAALYALSPLPTGQVPLLLIESFFTFLVTGMALVLTYWWKEKTSPVRAAMAGAAIGLGLFCRSTFFLLPGLLLAALFWKRAEGRPRAAAALLAGSFLLLTPWIVRNGRIFNTFIPLESGASAVNTWIGSVGLLYAPTFDLVAKGFQTEVVQEAQGQDELGKARFLFRTAWRNIAQNPGRYLWSCIERLPILWREQALFLLIGLLAFVWNRRLASSAWISWLIVAYMNIHLFMAAQPRYTRPVFGLTCLLAALSVTALVRRWAKVPALARVPAAQRMAGVYAAVFLVLGGGLYATASLKLLREASALAGETRDPELKRLSDQAVDLAVQRRWKEAEAMFSRVLDRDPLFTESLVSRAMVREQLGDASGARADYRRLTAILETGGVEEGPAVDARLNQF